jgi:hypothetical protein
MNTSEALGHIQDSFYKGRYYLDPHAKKRMAQRSVGFLDVRNVVTKATAADCLSYHDPDRPPPPGVTCWRIDGQDLDGAALQVGVDLTVDHLGGFTVVVTVI